MADSTDRSARTLTSRLCRARLLESIDAFNSTLGAFLPADVDGAYLRRSLSNGTFLTNLLVIIYGVTLNHIRRLLFPSLGQFLFHHAVEDMKFARSSPHWYIHTMLNVEWEPVWIWVSMTLLLTWARRRKEHLRMQNPGLRGIVDVLLVLGWWEHVFVRTCWTAAQVYAYTRSLSSGEAERDFLLQAMTEQPVKFVGQVGLVAHWIWTAVVPLVKRMSSKPLLAVVHGTLWGGTAYVIRYSNKYFIFLEMSDMLVTWVWIGLGVMVVCGESLHRWVDTTRKPRGKAHIS